MSDSFSSTNNSTSSYSPQQLGWRPFFQQQISLGEWEQVRFARVIAQHRDGYLLILPESDTSIASQIKLPVSEKLPSMAVGDWLLLDHSLQFVRLLDRLSQFDRKSVGTKNQTQLIAANVDSLFIVSSMNSDFNLNRLERYLSLAHEAGAEPIVVLTKVDCCDDPNVYIEQVQALHSSLIIEPINALSRESVESLQPWCGTGQTVAVMGSSGVGKSTLINSLMGSVNQQTASIREDDSKGRHTTTSRTLSILPSGGILIDTPGMRELQLSSSDHGIAETFSDIIDAAADCKFQNCKHRSEPGCAVLKAIDSGNIDQRRLDNYFKLLREQARQDASKVELHNKNRMFSRTVRSIMKTSPKHGRY